jgi:hypothetical protein
MNAELNSLDGPNTPGGDLRAVTTEDVTHFGGRRLTRPVQSRPATHLRLTATAGACVAPAGDDRGRVSARGT